MSSCYRWMGLVVVLLSVQSSYSIEISFIASNGGESTSIWNYYDVDDTITVDETAIASFNSVGIADSRVVTGSGDFGIKQEYCGISGILGYNNVKAEESSSVDISSSASINPETISMQQSASIIEAKNVELMIGGSDGTRYALCSPSVASGSLTDISTLTVNNNGVVVCDPLNVTGDGINVTSEAGNGNDSVLVLLRVPTGTYDGDVTSSTGNSSTVTVLLRVDGDFNATVQTTSNGVTTEVNRTFEDDDENSLMRFTSSSSNPVRTLILPITYCIRPWDDIKNTVNKSNSVDTIELLYGTFNIDNILINKTLTIVGQGQGATTILGGISGESVFVLRNETGSQANIRISDMSISGGTVRTIGEGGAIRNLVTNGKVTIDDVDFTDNSATESGNAIINIGIMELNNCNFYNNRPAVGCEFVQGGSIFNSADLTLNDCRIRGNRAKHGAGIYNDGGTITANNCYIQDNIANGNGSGIYNEGGTVTLNECWIERNRADGFLTEGYGGGIYNNGTLVLNWDRILDNEAGAWRGGGGYYNNTAGGSVSGRNTCFINGNTADGRINEWQDGP